MNRKLPALMQGAEPFYFPGSEIGCLCLHGLAASPAEVRWLGEHLAERGLTVYGPRLTGHGIAYRSMAHTRWQDWYAHALDGYALLRQRCSQVYVAGLSMGGLLTLLLAAAEDVNGIAVLAAPVALPRENLLRLAQVLKYVRPYFDARDQSDFPARLLEEQRRRGEPMLGRVRYERWPYRALEELYKLMKVVEPQLPGITEPALLIYSEADETVPVLNQTLIQKRISSTVIQSHTLTMSGHILTQDREHERVLQLVGDFIEQQAAMRL